MNGGAIRIGSIAGIPIRIHVTFLIILPFLAFGFARVYREAARAAEVPPEQLGGSPLLWGFVVALALFVSVLLHELAHSLYAMKAGGRVRDITLLMIGGVSQISEPPKTPRGEAVMALVGPLASFAILGLVDGNLLLLVIAFFVYVGAESESRAVLVKAMLGHIRVRDLVRSRPEPVDPSASVFEVGERMIRERRTGFPVARGAEVLGVISLEDVQRVPPAERARLPVSDAVQRVAPVDADDEASKALRLFAEARTKLVPVLDGGRLYGVLSQTDVARGLQLGELEATQHPRSRGPAHPGLTEAGQHV